jgi:hypothetical protein
MFNSLLIYFLKSVDKKLYKIYKYYYFFGLNFHDRLIKETY